MEGCGRCFYWLKCPGDETHGWCRRKQDFTEREEICGMAIDKDTREILR